MNVDNIHLRPDSVNCFSTDSQDTESRQVNFGPFSVGISPARAPIPLSQAAGATTDSAECDDTSRFENVGAVSSDQAVSHLNVNPALIANTGKVFDQNGKIPVEFINEMTDLLKKIYTPAEISEIKNEDFLLPLLTPEEATDEDNLSYSEYLDLNDPELEVEIRGVPIPDVQKHTLKEHTLKPGTEPEVKAVYSFCNSDWNIHDWQSVRIVFGILESGDPFQFVYSFNVSRQSLDCSVLLIAPDWNSLIDNVKDDYVKKFAENMSEYNSELLDDWLKIPPSGSLTDIRDKLKIVLNPDLLDKFCQQVL